MASEENLEPKTCPQDEESQRVSVCAAQHGTSYDIPSCNSCRQKSSFGFSKKEQLIVVSHL